MNCEGVCLKRRRLSVVGGFKRQEIGDVEACISRRTVRGGGEGRGGEGE